MIELEHRSSLLEDMAYCIHIHRATNGSLSVSWPTTSFNEHVTTMTRFATFSNDRPSAVLVLGCCQRRTTTYTQQQHPRHSFTSFSSISSPYPLLVLIMVYIRQDQLPKLKEYKYSGVDKSLISRYILKPFYTNFVIHLFPMSMA